MRNLALEIDNGTGYQWAWLSEDASVQIENVNPVFDTEAGGTFTHSISLDVARNSHILGAAADFRGPKIFNLLRKKKARLWIMGYPVTGIIRLDSELTVEDGKVEIEIASNTKELSDLLEGVNCRDVDISDDKIMLGYAFAEYMDFKVKMIETLWKHAYIYDDSGHAISEYYIDKTTESEVKHSIALPKMLFTHWRGGTQSGLNLQEKDFTNIHYPYTPGSSYNKNDQSSYPYCNVRSCYNKYTQKSDQSWEKKRGYMYGNTDRINSAPCFYVAYWFKKLWEQMGISVEKTNNKDGLEKIADYNRLAFFHFDPHYDWGELMVSSYDGFSEEDQIKNKLQVHLNLKTSCDGKFYVDSTDRSSYKTFKADSTWYTDILMYNVYANSKNFPDADAKNVLESMQSAFGARFLYDSSLTSLKIILVRDILRQSSTTELPCIVTKANKTELGTQGFRLKYESSSEATYNGITKVDDITGANEQYDADTTYNYTDWTNVIFISETSVPSTVTNATRKISIPNYISLVNHITNSEKTCYYSSSTANAYRIKVDSDAQDESTLYPSLFQVGMFQDWTEGDCSREAKDDGLIEEVSIPFTPAIGNDINIANEKDIFLNNLDAPLEQIYAQLIDGEIHNVDIEGKGETFVTQDCTYKDLVLSTCMDYGKDNDGNTKGIRTALKGNLTLTLKGLEMYDISEDGPYYQYTHDSLLLGIMRGSGSDASLDFYGHNYDDENGDMWVETAGTNSEFTFDNIDDYDKSYDYDGEIVSVSTVTISKVQVPTYLNTYFGDSNANLTAESRKVTKAQMAAKGWYIDGDYATVYTMTYRYGEYEYLMTPIKDDGTILKESELEAYFLSVAQTAAVNPDDVVVVADSNRDKLFIGRYKYNKNHYESNAYATLLHDLHDVYYGSGTTIRIPNIYGYNYNSDYDFPLSLKLRAEKENPGYDPTCSKKGYTYSADGTKVTLKNGTVVPNQRFFPINGANAAGRGLGDRFYKEYAYWVLNRKILEMNVEAEAAILTGIDMTKRYRIGGFEGFIKDYSYTVSMKEGVTNAKINLYYI